MNLKYFYVHKFYEPNYYTVIITAQGNSTSQFTSGNIILTSYILSGNQGTPGYSLQSYINVRNAETFTLNKWQLVYISGAQNKNKALIQNKNQSVVFVIGIGRCNDISNSSVITTFNQNGFN